MEVEVNMATLPLYQPTGFLPADIPRLDRADVKEAQAQLTTITSALDRVSQFAFKKAEEQAEREGLQYGAENQPSAEQVMAAMEAGKSPQELFAQPNTTFGNAARKVQAAQLRNELEVKVRTEFTRLSGMIEAGAFNLKDVQTEIKAITDGYGRAISSISPEEGLRFRASAGSAGAPVYAKAADRAYKIYGEQLEVNAKDLIAQSPIIMSNIIEVEQDPVKLKGRIMAERERVMDILRQRNDPQFFSAQMKVFNEQLTSVVVNQMLKPEFSKNVSDGYSKLESGNVGKLSELYKGLNRDEVLSTYMKKVNERKQINDINKANSTAANEGTATNLLIEFYTPGTTQLRKNEIGRALVRTGTMSADKVERYLNPDVNDGDPFVQANISYRVSTGQIASLEDLRKETDAAGLSGRQYTPLAQKFIGRSEKDEGSAIKKISRTAGFGDIRPGRSKDTEAQFTKEQTLLNYYEEEKRTAIEKTGSFNADQAADAAILRYNTVDKNDVQKNKAQDDLAKISADIQKRKKIKGDFSINENTNVDDLLSSGRITNDEFSYIKKRQEILRKAQQ
jgi:hypothetical protein